YSFETAYDEAYAQTRLSPGQSLFYLAIKDCFEVNKPNIFNLGPGTGREIWYKSLFANRTGDEAFVMVLKNTLLNKAKITAYEQFEKSKLVARRLQYESRSNSPQYESRSNSPAQNLVTPGPRMGPGRPSAIVWPFANQIVEAIPPPQNWPTR